MTLCLMITEILGALHVPPKRVRVNDGLVKFQRLTLFWGIVSGKLIIKSQGCRFVPYTSSETKPQMVPVDLNIGFQGLALIQGQIYNRESMVVFGSSKRW